VDVEDKDDVSDEALDANEEEGGEFNEFLRRLVSLTYSMGEGLCAEQRCTEACTAMGPSVGTASEFRLRENSSENLVCTMDAGCAFWSVRNLFG